MERTHVKLVSGLDTEFSGDELTQARQNAIAERIARVLRERKRVGEERRKQERDNWLRNSQLQRERYLLRMHADREMPGKEARQSALCE
jgi:hypothetical protein